MEKKLAVMTVEEVAERWGVNPRTIREEIARGKIKAIRIGRLVKISRSHVEFIESGGGRAA